MHYYYKFNGYVSVGKCLFDTKERTSYQMKRVGCIFLHFSGNRKIDRISIQYPLLVLGEIKRIFVFTNYSSRPSSTAFSLPLLIFLAFFLFSLPPPYSPCLPIFQLRPIFRFQCVPFLFRCKKMIRIPISAVIPPSKNSLRTKIHTKNEKKAIKKCSQCLCLVAEPELELFTDKYGIDCRQKRNNFIYFYHFCMVFSLFSKGLFMVCVCVCFICM